MEHAHHKEKPRRGGEPTDKHAGHRAEDFLRKFWVVLALTVPILAYSELAETAFGRRAPDFPGSDYVALLLGSVAFFYGGFVFLQGAARELRARLPGMMTLIALAISAAYAFSVFAVLTGREPLLWELATLIAVMLVGHFIEMRAVAGARGALRELAKLLPDTAEVLRGGSPQTVPLAELREGDVVLVRPGGRIPADGVVVAGESDADESLLTGESRPVPKRSGSAVVAGSTNGDGSLEVRLEKLGERTFLAGVMRLVAEAEASKSRLQTLSDRAAFYLTAVAVAGGAATFAAWLFAEAGTAFAVERLVAVLVIACPHALGLAIPLVASISTTMASRNGFFVKRRLALEAARDVSVVLFDKTGTLTTGRFAVAALVPAGSSSPEEILGLAASVNRYAEHPLARAIVARAEAEGVTLREAANVRRIPGKGVRGDVEGKEVLVGSDALLAESGAGAPGAYLARMKGFAAEGKTVNHVVSGGTVVGGVAFEDAVREESREAVRALRAMGIKVAMITGDAEDVALRVARDLGIDEYFARVLPGEKAEAVRKLRARGERVAMVGDGVNDAPALAEADLGVAIGAGTNVAIESAGVILVKNDPRDVPKIIRLSRLTYVKMLQNLFWATAYNVAALPLAAGALVSYGILIEPAVAAVFMSLSTVIVAANAALLRRRTLA